MLSGDGSSSKSARTSDDGSILAWPDFPGNGYFERVIVASVGGTRRRPPSARRNRPVLLTYEATGARAADGARGGAAGGRPRGAGARVGGPHARAPALARRAAPPRGRTAPGQRAPRGIASATRMQFAISRAFDRSGNEASSRLRQVVNRTASMAAARASADAAGFRPSSRPRRGPAGSGASA